MKIAKLALVLVFLTVNLFTIAAQEPDSAKFRPFPKDSLKHMVDSLTRLPADTQVNIYSKDAIQDEVSYKASDSFPIYFEGNTMVLYHKAEITYQEIQLNAGIIKIDWDQNLIYAEGITDSLGTYQEAPVFKEGDQTFKAKKIIYNFKSKKAKIYELYTNEGENFILGEEVKKDKDDNLYVQNARFTSCNDPNPHFYIASSKIKILKDKIITGPAWLEIEEIPMPLWVPFGFFPKENKRSSGLVFPAYGESTDRGFYLKGLGYYLGLNDHFDLLLQGDIYSRGSWMASAATNYAVRYKYRGNMKVSYGINKFGDPETSEFRQDNDFSINWTHTQDPKARPNSSFSASVNAGSQNSFRNNSTNANEIVQNTLSSSISYSKSFAGTPFSMTSSLRHSQNLSDHSMNLTVPDISMNMKKIFPFRSNKGIQKKRWYNDIGLTYSANFKNSLSTTDSMLFDAATWEEWKNGIRHSVPLSTSFKLLKYITFSPSMNYTGRTYFERNKKVFYENYQGTETDTLINEIEKGVFQINDVSASASINTRIYGTFDKSQFKFFKLLNIEAIRHTISPSASISWSPDLSDPKFGYYETIISDTAGTELTYSPYSGMIYGVPGSGRRGNINFSIANYLEAKMIDKNDTGKTNIKKVKLLESFNVSGSYDLYRDSMKLSVLGFTGRTTLFNRKFNINFSGRINPYYLTADSHFVDRLGFLENQFAGHLTNANISINTNLNSSKKGKSNASMFDGYVGFPYDNYIDWNVPWNVSLSYSLVYKNYYTNSSGQVLNDPDVTQTLNFSGNISLTEKWKINFRSGYDFKLKKLSYTSLDIYRDLHCWEMSFSWIPFGYRQSYVFKINVKSSTLKDLKFDKKKDYFDNTDF